MVNRSNIIYRNKLLIRTFNLLINLAFISIKICPNFFCLFNATNLSKEVEAVKLKHGFDLHLCPQWTTIDLNG